MASDHWQGRLASWVRRRGLTWQVCWGVSALALVVGAVAAFDGGVPAPVAWTGAIFVWAIGVFFAVAGHVTYKGYSARLRAIEEELAEQARWRATPAEERAARGGRRATSKVNVRSDGFRWPAERRRR